MKKLLYSLLLLSSAALMPMGIENNNPDNQKTLELKQSIQSFFTHKPSQKTTDSRCRLIGMNLDLRDDINVINVLNAITKENFIGNDPSVYAVLKTLIIRSRPVHFASSNDDLEQLINMENEAHEVEAFEWTKNKLAGMTYVSLLKHINQEVNNTARLNGPSFKRTTINNITALFECPQFHSPKYLDPLAHSLSKYPLKAIDALQQAIARKASTPNHKKVVSDFFSNKVKNKVISNMKLSLELELQQEPESVKSLHELVDHIAETEVLLPLQQ